MDTLYVLLRGPLALLAFAVFIGGTAFQIIRFLVVSRKTMDSPITTRPPAIQAEPVTPSRRYALFKSTIFGTHPGMALLSLVFHVLLILAPLLVLAHSIMINESWGFRLFSLPEKTTDVMTVLVMACAAVFLGRRLFFKRVRALTSLNDYLVLVLAISPFVTGFLTYHQIFHYRTVAMLHMATGELLLMAIPFTKLVHMVFYFINRLLFNQEYSFRNGGRTW
jgi:nitrate reductase gamma subunit